MAYGAIPSLPGPWRQLGNSVVFAGENSTVGRELFIDRFGEPPVAPVITGPSAITPSLRPTVTWNAVGSVTEYDIWIKAALNN